jgi:hypothetical protein
MTAPAERPDDARPSRRERTLVLLLVAAGLALRLPHLGAELIELHSWRQADGVMIARNLQLDGFDLLHPRIDWAGDQPGYVGTELPLVPLAVALLWTAFGERLVIARLVALAAFAAAALFLHRLARLDFGPRVAAIALFVFLTSPLGIHYSRAFLPESAMLAGQLAALAFAARWARDGRERDRWLAVASAALAMLVKLPAGVVLLPMAVLAWQRDGAALLRSRRHWLALAAALAPSLLWYAHAAALARAHEPHHLFGENNWLWSTGAAVLLDGEFALRLLRRGLALLLGPLGALAAAAGLVALVRHSARRFYLLWGAGLAFATLIGWQAQARHEYYQLPFVPLAAVLAGLSVERWLLGPPGASVGALRVALLAGLAAAQLLVGLALAETRAFSARAWRMSEAARWVAARTRPADLLVVADHADPTLLAVARRRGWHYPDPSPGRRGGTWSIERVEALGARGADYFVALRRSEIPADAPPPAYRRIVGALPDSVGDPLPESVYLDEHPELERELRDRYRVAASGPSAVLFDLRGPASAGAPP